MRTFFSFELLFSFFYPLFMVLLRVTDLRGLLAVFHIVEPPQEVPASRFRARKLPQYATFVLVLTFLCGLCKVLEDGAATGRLV
jgi:hypothetical protein